MRYAVIGGDMRFVRLAGMLNESGRETIGFLQENADENSGNLAELMKCSVIISNWPMRWPLSKTKISPEEILAKISPGSTLLLCGPKFPEAQNDDLNYVNLWEDERLLIENAWLTAEAAVASALRRCGGSLLHANCAVIGCGRIGRALTEILKNMGAQVTIISRSSEKRRQAQEKGVKAADCTEIKAVLPEQRFIFSTPPCQVLNEESLAFVRKDALLMDLASPPYGFDLDIALEMGINACREPGLPGRYCPVSAARALYHAVVRWEEEDHG